MQMVLGDHELLDRAEQQEKDVRNGGEIVRTWRKAEETVYGPSCDAGVFFLTCCRINRLRLLVARPKPKLGPAAA